jgi:hypothetical protein
MGEKGTIRRQDPRVLTLSEIRARVEDLAEDMARRLQGKQAVSFEGGVQAIPIDARSFIAMMEGYTSPN